MPGGDFRISIRTFEKFEPSCNLKFWQTIAMYFPEEVDPVLYIYNTYRLSLLQQI
jgi:hypothetical protein